MTGEVEEDHVRLFSILHPYALRKSLDAQKNNTRFVHYSSAQAAMSIIRKKEIWLRKATCMNDYSEVQHGIDSLAKAYRSEKGDVFKRALGLLHPEIQNRVEQLFDGYAPTFRVNTYLTCMSEHDDNEDRFGRLSMWRAYGARAGVALVLNNGVFLRPSSAIGAYTSPVAYLSENGVADELVAIARNIETDADFLKAQDVDSLVTFIFRMFQFSVLCMKHPGFKEEAEWRIVFSPEENPHDRLVKSVELFDGVPQPVYKLPLLNYPDEGFVGAEIPELLNRLIIGPSEFGWEIRDAFVSLLEEVGVEDAPNKVVVSAIPLRT